MIFTVDTKVLSERTLFIIANLFSILESVNMRLEKLVLTLITAVGSTCNQISIITRQDIIRLCYEALAYEITT
jgi:hypothetical protein